MPPNLGGLTARRRELSRPLPLSANELAVVGDTGFGSTGRNPNLPDYSDFVVLQVPGIRG